MARNKLDLFFSSASALGWALAILLAYISLGAALGIGGLGWLVAGFLGWVAFKKAWDLFPVALLLFFLYVVGGWLPAPIWRFPSAGFLIPFALTCVCCLPFAHLRSHFRWFRRGQIDQVTLALLVLTGLLTALVMVLWALWTDYLGLASSMPSSARSLPRWFLLLIGIPGFALMNAFAEEVVYRGLIQEALHARFPRKLAFALVLQASAFAAAHFQGGFPTGWMGYFMTFSYALALGLLRWRSAGLLAPFLAHVMADLVIGVTLLLLSS